MAAWAAIALPVLASAQEMSDATKCVSFQDPKETEIRIH